MQLAEGKTFYFGNFVEINFLDLPDKATRAMPKRQPFTILKWISIEYFTITFDVVNSRDWKSLKAFQLMFAL